MDDECIHGLGPVAACIICNGREARERAAANVVEYRFSAQFDGPAACGHHVERGDVLAYGHGEWQAEAVA